ncbi:MAG: hypothetical protein JWP81_4955 [Ferruginibacter sp.]|nr:hypothetical protein [Ferruginibacter sp.]
MERNLHTDDFEQLLREKSEEFRMYPSKRIWHSIYNNIHPGRKWPSVAMSITLITTLLLVGYLNTKNTGFYNTSTEKLTNGKANTPNHSPLVNSTTLTGQTGTEAPTSSIKNTPIGLALKNNLRQNAVSTNTPILTGIKAAGSPALEMAVANQPALSGKIIVSKDQPSVNVPLFTEPFQTVAKVGVIQKSTQRQPDNISHDQIVTISDEPAVLTQVQKIAINDILENVLPEDYGSSDRYRKIAVSIQNRSSYADNNLTATTQNTQDFVSTREREWIENYALYNRPASRKWANKLSWQMYATPSVVYRSLYNDYNFGTTLNATPPLAIASNGDINDDVIQKPSLGFEIGTGLQYSISKGIKITAGVQLNYTRYTSNAFQNTHPVATRLSMHDYKTNMTYEEYRTTPYSNKSGPEPIKLHNQTVQISLPIGLDFKLIGNENLQWNIGATIQPTYVPLGKSYLISSDRRYYIKETSMLNRWNLNAGVETFVSYKSSNGITYQLGPQFRTQLFSTNNKKIAVEEKLLTYGLKFGISKTLK